VSDDDDHMSDRDMGAPSPGGMSSLGGGSRPSSPLGGIDTSHVPSLDETPLMNSTRTSRSASKAAAAAMAAASLDDDEQVKIFVMRFINFNPFAKFTAVKRSGLMVCQNVNLLSV
jgi:hypothetical protein